MHAEISARDQMIIYMHTGMKVLRGTIKRLFLKKAKGLFLVGSQVRISHGSHIIREKCNV